MSIETKLLHRLEHLDEGQKYELLEFVDGLIKSKGLPPIKDVLSLDDIKNTVIPFCSEYPIRKIGVFGSYARGQADEESDIDLVVDFESEIGLLEFSGLKVRLENALKKKIDLVEPETMFESIRINMEKEVIVIYEKKQ